MAQNIDIRERLKEKVEEADFSLVLKKREDDPIGWAKITLELAEALSELADIEDDAAAFPFYHDAVLAFEGALNVLRSHEHFSRRAALTLRLIRTLRNYGTREGGENGLIHLHHGLRLSERLSHELSMPEHSYDKAVADVERGLLYRALADIDRQEKRQAHLQNAAKILWKAAGNLRAKEQFKEWAFALMALGLSLGELSRFENDEDASKSLKTAIDAFKSATAFYRPDEHPHDWALAQFEMGRSYIMLARKGEEEKAAQAALHAVEAFKLVLSMDEAVLGEEHFIRAQTDLAQTLSLLATSYPDKAPKDAIYDAIVLYRSNLTHERMQQDLIATALTQGALGRILAAYGLVKGGKDGIAMRLEAVTALKKSVGTELKQLHPQEWLNNLIELATTLHSLADEGPREARSEKLEEVAALYDTICNLVSKEREPALWAHLQQWQALAFAHLGEDDPTTRGMQRMKLAELGFRQALTVVIVHDEKEKYQQLQNNLGHLLYAISQRDECTNPVSFLTAAAGAMEALQKSIDENAQRPSWLMARLHLALILWRRGVVKSPNGQEDFADADELFTETSQELEIPPVDALELKSNHAGLLIDWGESDLTRLGLQRLKKARALFSEIAATAQKSNLQDVENNALKGLGQSVKAIARHRKQQFFLKRLFWY